MKAVVFGEILWDVFGDEAHIGGAPLNFGAHMSKLGADVSIVSAVGRDEFGKRATDITAGYGIDVSQVEELDMPTGYCRVTLKDGTPSYELVRDVAYDAIPEPSSDFFSGDVLYFGSLACRDARSRATAEKLLGGTWNEIFYDINIRQNFYSDELIDMSLKRATILKISREEISVLGIDGDLEQIALEVSRRYPNLRHIIVTLDKDGAFALECASGNIYYAPKPSSTVVSTVGAGDSFSACFVYHHLKGDGIEKSLSAACALSDFVVTRLEAIPDYPEKLKKEIL